VAVAWLTDVGSGDPVAIVAVAEAVRDLDAVAAWDSVMLSV